MEAQSVEELMLDYSRVNTAVLLQGEILSASFAADLRPTASARVDIKVIPILPSSPPQEAAPVVADEADAGCLSEGLEGLFNGSELRGRVVIGDDIGHIDYSSVPFSGPPAPSLCAAISISLLHMVGPRDGDITVLDRTVRITNQVLVDQFQSLCHTQMVLLIRAILLLSRDSLLFIRVLIFFFLIFLVFSVLVLSRVLYAPIKLVLNPILVLVWVRVLVWFWVDSLQFL